MSAFPARTRTAPLPVLSAVVAAGLAASLLSSAAPVAANAPRPPQANQLGTLTTIAGIPGAAAGNAGDGKSATSAAARFGNLRDAVYGPDGSLYLADSSNHVVRRVSPSGVLSTVAGTGQPRRSGEDLPGATAALHYPHGLAVTPDGSHLLVAESGAGRIRALNLRTWRLHTYVGRTGTNLGEPAYGGDGGPALGAGLVWPSGMSFTRDGDLLIVDSTNHRVRKVTNPGQPEARITTVAGNGKRGAAPGQPSIGDGGPAPNAELNVPRAAIELPDGALLISEEEGNRIRRVSPDGVISTFAGGSAFPRLGVENGYGDGGPARVARFFRPRDLRLAPDGRSVFVSDRDNGSVRRIELAGANRISTIAGKTGFRGWNGSGTPATTARFRLVFGLSVSNGWLVIVDGGNRAVHLVGVATSATARRATTITVARVTGTRCQATARLRGTAAVGANGFTVQVQGGKRWRIAKTGRVQAGTWRAKVKINGPRRVRVSAGGESAKTKVRVRALPSCSTV